MKDYDLSFVGFAPQLVLPFFRRLRKKPVIEDFFISLYDTLVQDRKKFRSGSLQFRPVALFAFQRFPQPGDCFFLCRYFLRGCLRIL